MRAMRYSNKITCRPRAAKVHGKAFYMEHKRHVSKMRSPVDTPNDILGLKKRPRFKVAQIKDAVMMQ